MPQASQASCSMSEKAVSAVLLLSLTSWVNLLALIFHHTSIRTLPWICTSISVGFTTLIYFLEVNHPGFCTRSHAGVSFILIVVWVLNLIWQTFLKGCPFPVVCNGYLSAWLSIYFAGVYVLESNELVRQTFESTQAAVDNVSEHSKVEPQEQKEYSTLEK